MTGALHYEWARLRSLRQTWWLTGGSMAVTALVAWGYCGIVAGLLSDGIRVEPAEAVLLVLGKASMAPIAAGIIGVLAAAGDYRHGTMRTTLLVTPRRTAALGAKATVAAGFGVALAGSNLAVGWIVGSLSLGDRPGLLLPLLTAAHFHVAQILLVAGWAVIGVALGTLLRSQVLALLLLLALPMVVEPAVRTAGVVSGAGWLARSAAYLPFNAGTAMADITGGLTGAVLPSADQRAHPIVGAVVFLAAIVAVAGAAVATFRRRDV